VTKSRVFSPGPKEDRKKERNQISRTPPDPRWIRRRRDHDHAATCSSAARHPRQEFSRQVRDRRPALHCARARDCGALTAVVCAHCPLEPHLIFQLPVVAKSCSNPRAHKAEVHYRQGSLVDPRPCWQVLRAQTNTILILNPSSNPLYSSSLTFPNICTCAKRSQTNLKCPPFSACYFMTHSLTTHFFFCV